MELFFKNSNSLKLDFISVHYKLLDYKEPIIDSRSLEQLGVGNGERWGVFVNYSLKT